MEHILSKLLEDFEQGKMDRRQLIRNLVMAATATSVAAAESKPIAKAVYINHISYRVADYAKTRDFYAGLFGMKVSEDNGKQCNLTVGDSVIIPRSWSSDTPRVDHICYTMANWDTDKTIFTDSVRELKSRGLVTRVGKDSFHVKDPDGFDVQIGGKDP
jgi:catechol 2,3-dioxygenase-like lactoylglutathione lyase family enzyme